MTVGLYSFAYLPLITENNADKKAEVSANKIPYRESPSTLKIMYNPATTINPKSTSYQMTFLPKKRGSNNEVKKAPVDKQAKVTEILDTLMALKKVNQCKAMINPANKKPIIALGGTCKDIFL